MKHVVSKKQVLAVIAAVTLAMAVSVQAQREPESLGSSSQELKIERQKTKPPANSPGGSACKQGYVWREARQGDLVCVTPQTREEVAQQNRMARRFWVNGAYGPHTCVPGRVWRDAFQGDDVCVEPSVRDDVRRDNASAAERRQGAGQSATPQARWSSYNFAPPNAGVLVYTVMPDGNAACASYDARACLWGLGSTQIDFARVRPLVCGGPHRAIWGATGYEDPKHWCSVARRLRAGIN